MKRRAFIQSSVALGGLTAALPMLGEAKQDKGQVRAYRQLGKTDIKMSDISYGAGKLPSPSMVLRAVDAGINYFDTAPDYGGSEGYIGQAMPKIQRDKIYIASKYCGAQPYQAGVSHLQPGTTKDEYKKAVEDSLKRMKTDYMDVVFVHAIGEINDYEAEKTRLLDENMLAATEELKKEGKVRYLAVSSHGQYNMETLLMDAVRSKHYDIIMPAFNFMKFPKVPDVLKEAKARGVGVVAMKTLAGAREMELDKGETPFEHAAFKWVLSHPEVAGLIVTIKSARHINHYLQASGAEMTAADQRALDKYAALYGNDYCRTGCSECEPACPFEVPVASILRYQMYFEDYGDQKDAMQAYSHLSKNAAGCLGCAADPCTAACPHGLPVGVKLRAAHQALSFSA
jgi:predicted aldo/keto reductase-like oxidoreductase